MTIRNLPSIKAFDGLSGLSFEPDESALARWNPEVQAAVEGDANVISIYGVIGEDFWTGEGFTSKKLAGILRSIGKKDISVNVNSPGGDFFEGIACYNLLREHPAKVTVKVMGLAASAASVIAMAGDEVLISEIGFLMIHNAWTIAMGDRNDFAKAADTLKEFDSAMAGLYASRAGADAKTVAKWMDDETWFGGQKAIDEGLATGLLSAEEVDEKPSAQTKSLAAVRRVDALLAKQGLPRSERRSLLGEVKNGKPGAAVQEHEPATLDAGTIAAISQLTQSMRS